MGWEAWFTAGVVAAVISLLATERLPPAFVMLGAVVVLLISGVIDAGQAFAGFSNPAPITVAALYVLAGAAEVTGALEPVTQRALGTTQTGERARLLRVVAPTSATSAFLNNTPIVAMVAPRIVAWGRQTGTSPSPYLMPLSFAAILGGMATLIGTSTNIIISGLLQESGRDPLGFFEISWVGVPAALAGGALMVALAPALVVRRRAPTDEIGSDAREFTVEMIVRAQSPLVGRTVGDAGLRNLEGVYLVEIERDGHVIAPVAPNEVLTEDDRLTFAGNVDRVLDLQRIPGLVSPEERHFRVADPGGASSFHSGGPSFYEVVIAPGSDLAGTTLKQAGFRGRYGGAVLAIHRSGERVPAKLGEVSLRPGDVLLVLADADFRSRWHGHPDFLVVSPFDTKIPVRRHKALAIPIVVAALAATVTTGLLSILEAALLAALALVVARVLTPAEARRSVDLNVIVLIAASFGVGAAVLTSGLAETIASGLTQGFEGLGEIGVLLGVLLATVILTELVTNNAAAILMFPIAMATAAQTGMEPRALAIAVAVAASASFLTPIGYQTNTMVYGLGGYRYTDFVRLGAPLTITVLATALLVIPRVWG